VNKACPTKGFHQSASGNHRVTLLDVILYLITVARKEKRERERERH